eukprot:1277225-Alexandrium_andersonii.AAC.1
MNPGRGQCAACSCCRLARCRVWSPHVVFHTPVAALFCVAAQSVGLGHYLPFRPARGGGWCNAGGDEQPVSSVALVRSG